MNVQLHTSRSDLPLDAELFPKVRNGHLRNKPRGGIWTSTFIDRQVGSAWVQQMYAMEFIERGQQLPSYLLTPKEDARIYTIDSVQDMYRLYDNYSYKELGTFETIDFEKLSIEYDAVHLTERGQIVTRLVGIHNPNDYEPNRSMWQSLNGWDCESTVWLNWAFSNVQYLGELAYVNQWHD
jgi:hypothetical protein